MIKKFIVSQFFLISVAAIISSLISFFINEILFLNILGCFILGFINKLFLSRRVKLFFGFGISSSLTSYSKWIMNIFITFDKKSYLHSCLIVSYHLMLGIVFLFIGYLLAEKLNKIIYRIKRY